MSWNDGVGNKFDNVLTTDIEELTSFQFMFYKFKFTECTFSNKTSVLMQMQKMHESRTFNPYEFVDYLLFRRIKFNLYFVPVPSLGLKENLLNLKHVIRLNIRKVRGVSG